jgi:hypothetical protein
MPDLVSSREGPVLTYTTPSGKLGVLRWDGAAWADLGGSPQRDADVFVARHAITIDADGAPIVVWTEDDSERESRLSLFASVWDGTAWSPLGDDLSLGITVRHVVAHGAGDPVVSWLECAESCVRYVKAWDGAAWVQLGDAREEARHWLDAALALDGLGNVFLLTFHEEDDGRKLYVERWDGAAWQRLGRAINTMVDAAPYGWAIAVGEDERPVVLLCERADTGVLSVTRAKRWDGATWVELGGSLVVDGESQQDHHALAIDRTGRWIAAWFETAPGVDTSGLHAKRWDGVDWQSLGATLNGEDEWADAWAPAIAAGNDGQVLIAWTRSWGVPQRFYEVVVGRYNELGQDPLAGQESGGAP